MSNRTVSTSTEDYIAQVDLYTTSDGPGTEIVGEGDYRARFLLARKGTPIPGKLAKRLGIDENFKLQPVQKAPPEEAAATVAPEQISSRSKRPQEPQATR